MPSERFIENNVIRNRSVLGYEESVYIRRCRAGRGFGIVDLMILPLRGPHRVVLVEAKLLTSVDVAANVTGQLLLYYAGVLNFGGRGVRTLRNFASNSPRKARSTRPKMLKTLTGGISPPEAAWEELKKGRKVRPEQVGMYIAINGEPPVALKSSLTTLAEHHGLEIGIVSVHRRDELEVWKPL